MNGMYYNVGNDYYPKKLKGLVNLLKTGVVVRVGVDCIGHTRNNYTQEAYKQELMKIFNDDLKVTLNEGAYSYSYNYKLKNYFIVKRNGNYFTVKKDKHSHYYTALLLGNAKITAWHRTTRKHLEEHYEVVENYTGKGDFEL